MKIGIIGGGAMGGLFASHLARAGHAVWIYDIDQPHVDAIGRDGLRVTRRDRTQLVAMPATSDPGAPGIVETAMLFVKYGQTRLAMASARPMIGAGTVIVTLQNGIGNPDLIRALYPNPVVHGLTTLTSELIGPGHIEASLDGVGETHVGTQQAGDRPRAEQICALLNAAGINCHLSGDIDLQIWKKLVVNCCLNSLCAITGLPVGPLVDQPGIWTLLDGLVAEICDVATADGIALDTAAASAYLRQVADQARAHAPSMLADIRARRPTEIGALNEAVTALAARLGRPAPLNGFLSLLVRGIEQSWGIGAPAPMAALQHDS